MVLSKKKRDLQSFYRNSPNNIKNNIVIFKDYLDDDKTNLITFHSAKGIEINTCFLLGIDKDFNLDKTEDLKLLYVGMTRASQNLYIQSNNNLI